MKLIIDQNNQVTEQVASEMIDKLYNLSQSNTLDNTSNLRGAINAPTAYEDAVTYLNTMWGPDLVVTAGAYYIRFADPNVLSVLLNAGIGDGTGISTSDAASANITNTFKNNTNIVSFDEFKYFTRPNATVNFSGCSNLERIDLTNCTRIPDFSNCSSLAYFNGSNSIQGVAIIPDGITAISSRWTRCNGVTELHFPNSLNTINQSVFEYMSNLSKVYFGSGITTIYSNAFYNDFALKEVHIPDLDTWLDINFVISSGDMSNPLQVAHHLYVNGTEVTSVDFTGRTSVGTNVLRGGSSITSVVLPSTITSIGARAFQGCTNLTILDLNLPNLTSLGSYAFNGTKIQAISSLGNIAALSQGCFYDCTQLANAIIPSTSTVIPNDCFNNCLSLTSVDLPSSVTTIGDRAFYDCRNLTTIDLTNVTTLGDSAFRGCGSLSRFHGPNSTVGEINLQNLTGNMHNAFVNLSQYAPSQIIYNIISLGSITEIGQWCFSTMRIETIHLPSTLTKIGSNAFTNCPYVHDIYWEGTMDQWVNINFYGGGANPCGINSVNFYVNGTPPTSYAFPSGTTEIKKFALEGVKGLTSVTIPNSVTSIGQSAFRNCSGLTSITIPNSVTSIGEEAFRGCRSLTSVSIPDSVTKINKVVFYECTGLTSVTIPNSVTSINDNAFFRCSSLTSIIIPSSVTYIGIDTFSSCVGLISVTINAVTPPTLGARAFNYTNCPIYVPAGSVSAYQSASGWSGLASRIQAIPTT